MSGDQQYPESEYHSAGEEHPTGEQGRAGAGVHATSAGYGEEQSGFGTVQGSVGTIRLLCPATRGVCTLRLGSREVPGRLRLVWSMAPHC